MEVYVVQLGYQRQEACSREPTTTGVDEGKVAEGARSMVGVHDNKLSVLSLDRTV